jgi:hypothetical protein
MIDLATTCLLWASVYPWSAKHLKLELYAIPKWGGLRRAHRATKSDLSPRHMSTLSITTLALYRSIRLYQEKEVLY